MKFGAYYNSRRQEIVWFRTNRAVDTGFYHRHSRRGESPDVYITDSVPDLIMKCYPWIHEEEVAFQNEAGSPGLRAEDKERISDRMMEQLVENLDPDDDTTWVDEPHWVKHVKSD
jgi:hypothetical protein